MFPVLASTNPTFWINLGKYTPKRRHLSKKRTARSQLLNMVFTDKQYFIHIRTFSRIRERLRTLFLKVISDVR